jgi:formamidopyrimidine-DNA glycosylase
MPELPEVETIRRGLKESLVGDEIVSVQILRADSVAHPAPAVMARELPGHKVFDVDRRGKYLLIIFSNGGRLVVHLRMSGRLLVLKGKTKVGKFLRVRLQLKSGRELHFEDMRVFGRLWFQASDQALEVVVPGLSLLGLEPLPQLSGKSIYELFRKKIQAIKSALLDQRFITGIGNIYADESLFCARLHPLMPAGKLTRPQADRLAQAINRVLNHAIELGGSSLRDYTNSAGVNGNYQHAAFVYGRKGEPCLSCGHLIERIKIAGRSSHFCPVCQKRK